MTDELAAPKVVDRSAFQAELGALRVREKAHPREGDAIAAARTTWEPAGAEPRLAISSTFRRRPRRAWLGRRDKY
jgi:hypothetical protein